MKKEITLKEAIDGIKGLFDFVPFGQHDGHQSFYTEKEDGTATFFFDKNQYWLHLEKRTEIEGENPNPCD